MTLEGKKTKPSTFTKKFKKMYGESADTRELTNLLNKRTPLTPAEQKESRVREKT